MLVMWLIYKGPLNLKFAAPPPAPYRARWGLTCRDSIQSGPVQRRATTTWTRRPARLLRNRNNHNTNTLIFYWVLQQSAAIGEECWRFRQSV